MLDGGFIMVAQLMGRDDFALKTFYIFNFSMMNK